MKKRTTITIQHVLNDQVSVFDAYRTNEKTLDWIIGNAGNFLDNRRYKEADELIKKVRSVDPDHAGALYLYGMRQLESKNISESKIALSRLLELTRSGKQTTVQPREGGISALTMVTSLYMYPAKEGGDHDDVHNLFQELYAEYCKDRGRLTKDERDLENIARCLERMDTILSEHRGSLAWAQSLVVELRKLLHEKAKGKGALLGKRCGLNIFLPSVVGHNAPTNLPEGIRLEFNIPMGNQPLTARPDVLYSIEDWLKQPVVYVDKEYSLQEIIYLFSNIDGAHADSQDQIEKVHARSGKMKLIKNEQIAYDIIYKICAFLVTWLAEYTELVEAFPPLEKYRGRYRFNYLMPGFIPDWYESKGGTIQIRF